MIRKANAADIPDVAVIFEEIHTEEEQGRMTVGWSRGVYPTEETAEAAIRAGDLYVMEENGRIVAAARINRQQVPEYADADWEYHAPDEEVLVLHTLVVSPSVNSRGLGRKFVKFYENMGKETGCPDLRMDTNEKNVRARALYEKLGYREAGIVDCLFNGIPGVRLVCLEKRV